jgi:hypothetical protein
MQKEEQEGGEHHLDSVEQPDSTVSVSQYQKDIDKLTLEMFMNKQTYRRYISKTDPAKHAEREAYLNNLAKYKRHILSMTEELFENPDKLVTTEVNDIFEKYSQTLIRHFKMKEIESANLYNKKGSSYGGGGGDDDDDDVLFGKIDEDNNAMEENMPPSHYPYGGGRGSFWGKDKIIKKR